VLCFIDTVNSVVLKLCASFPLSVLEGSRMAVVVSRSLMCRSELQLRLDDVLFVVGRMVMG
jgi:hypothetical protein